MPRKWARNDSLTWLTVEARGWGRVQLDGGGVVVLQRMATNLVFIQFVMVVTQPLIALFNTVLCCQILSDHVTINQYV